MIYTHQHFQKNLKIRTEICVIGSGAGGATVAATLSQRGKEVLLLEAGSYLTPKDFNQREDEMFAQLFWEKGGQGTSDHSIQILQGKGVGGSTNHNLNLCKRIPPVLRAYWQKKWGLSALSSQWERLYQSMEKRLEVSVIDEKKYLNENNALFKKGVLALGYAGGMLSHNRSHCIGAGFCLLGCSFNSKMNALRVLIPSAIRNGVQILANTVACRLIYKGKRVTHLEAQIWPPDSSKGTFSLQIEADHFCLSAGGTRSAGLLMRSHVPDPYQHLGKNLYLHPGLVVAGYFPKHPIYGWKGIPQSYECTEFLEFEPTASQRLWLVPAFAHPVGTATFIPGFGSAHREFMEKLPHLAVLSAVIHDSVSGTLKPKGDFDVAIDYWPYEEQEQQQYRLGLQEATRILFAAGASEVYIPYSPLLQIRSLQEISKIQHLALTPHQLPLTAVHPMGTLWMGEDPQKSVTSPQGRYHHLENLSIADTSLFPTSIGVPPQLSTYALGQWVGENIP
jgi:choline dehydrogenase-like flavoprotein